MYNVYMYPVFKQVIQTFVPTNYGLRLFLVRFVWVERSKQYFDEIENKLMDKSVNQLIDQRWAYNKYSVQY